MRSIVGASIGSYPHGGVLCGKEAIFEIGLLLAEELKNKTIIRSAMIPCVCVCVCACVCVLPRSKTYPAGDLDGVDCVGKSFRRCASSTGKPLCVEVLSLTSRVDA